MRTIWKYKIPLVAGEFTLSMPVGGRVLLVGLQGRDPVLWAEVELGAEKTSYRFVLVGTGGAVPDAPCRFVGTYQAGWFVGHVYQLGAV